MLVLSRRVGEEIVIDGEIRVRVVKASGNRITLGIEAPPHVSVHREELLQQLLRVAPEAKCEDENLQRRSA